MSYAETRRHTLAKTRLAMVDGNLVENVRSEIGGTSVRRYEGGYWGFAAMPGDGATVAERVAGEAHANVRAMGRFGGRTPIGLAGGTHRGEHAHRGRPALGSAETVAVLAALHAHIAGRYPGLGAVRMLMQDERHEKRVATSDGSETFNTIARALLHVILVAEDDAGAPVEVWTSVTGKGSLADLDLSVSALEPGLHAAHEHLQAKRHAVPARAGLHTVVMGPELAGVLAHEAMGHPCEADLVLAGAITGDLVGKPVASELVTMIDYAHTVDGAEAMAPVYCDDEGTPSADAVLIERGVLKGFMSSRETAARLGIAPSGSARAYAPADEPLVRMRNTAILAGTSQLDAMIAGVEDGYLLLKRTNGQADSTTEFMFGVGLGYEIRNGRLGRAIRDNTVSGSALKVLSSVDAVSDDVFWSCAGYCGKKQPMVVSMGGPAIRCRAQLGGS